jgi:hypothetical protein
MPWFRLEESFYFHPKVMAAGNAATGLWVRCATWSAQHLTDGRIPVATVRTMGSRAEMNACSRAGLWVQVDDEVIIPNWLEYQPSALEVKIRRERDAERKRIERGNADRDSVTGRYVSKRTPGGHG